MESLHTVRTLGARACAVKITITLLAMASSAAMADGGAAVGNPKESTGAIVGIVMTSARTPVAGATITASRVDGSGIRATISGTDGIYSFADVPSGKWAITAHVEGYADAGAPSLDVVASKAARFDVVMVAPPASAAASAVASAVSRSAPAPGASAPAPAAKPASPAIALGLQAPEPGPEVDNDTPFAFGDFTWLNGSPRNHAPAFDTKFFTPDIRLDAYYVNDYNHPVDHTIVGSTEEFRSGEVQLEQVSLGGDFHWENVRARFLSMFGLYSTTTPRNDASSGNIGGVGQWDLQDAYRYFSEANAGYHWDVNHGLNVDAGIFLSYIGLFSYYNYDNWTYQPSYVSSNTPWFFNGIRIQWFPTNKLKIEPWIINGWQSYAKFNSHPGVGGQILWLPTENLKLVFNNYGIGQDNLSNGGPFINNGVLVNYAKTNRIHTDDSIELKYYENHNNGGGISKAAFSLTLDAGCQYGGGVGCSSGPNKSNFLGWMLYDRYWFYHDVFALTFGGGAMTNNGRYLTLLPPINGATASTGTPYFPESPGQHAYQWDSTINFQYMPKEWITWWTELGFRHSDIPYFSGAGGVTPPFGNNGTPQDFACMSGASSGTNVLTQAYSTCGGPGSVWFPDLRTRESMWSFGVLVKF
ncbi:MAG TPA: TonB-dependent receptor [Steroidobacteraceae bacterium]